MKTDIRRNKMSKQSKALVKAKYNLSVNTAVLNENVALNRKDSKISPELIPNENMTQYLNETCFELLVFTFERDTTLRLLKSFQ